MLLNAKSIKNYDHIIMAELENHRIEIAVLTETWIMSNQQDISWLNQSEFKQGTMTSSPTTDLGTSEGE